MFAEWLKKRAEIKAKRDDWFLVHQESSGWERTDRAGNKEEFHLLYSFYENALGERKFDVATTSRDPRQVECYKRDGFYLINVVPWEKGVPVPEIDTYEQARKKLMVAKIKR